MAVPKLCRIVAACALMVFLPQPARTAEVHELPGITVLAPATLTEALTDAVREYIRANQASVTLQFDSVAELAIRIEEGAAADIFITSDPKWMTQLKSQGLIDVYSQSNLLSARLALLSAAPGPWANKTLASEEDVKTFLRSLPQGSALWVGDPKGAPAGRHAKAVLTKLSLWRETQALQRYAPHSRAVAQAVAKDPSALGLAYASEAANNRALHVIYELPDALMPSAVFQYAVVAGENMAEARKFAAYLKSPLAAAAFARHGFLPAAKTP